MPNTKRGAAGVEELVYVPLGGAGEIGMNMYLYGLGPANDRRWLMVDIGVTFPGTYEPGVDIIMPDTRFIEDEGDRLVGIILTHAHEDHFGALIDLWPDLRAPVYATRFAAGLLRAKLNEYGGDPDLVITDVGESERLKIGPFDVELVSVAHSIPECNALVIRGAGGVVVHTGDWKLDNEPVVGSVTNEARLEEIGNEGVDVLICDSTNVLREGVSITEGDVGRALTDVIKAAPQVVAVTTFASNIARVASIANATKAAGRHLVVAGRALSRNIRVAQENGLLPEDFTFSDQNEFGYLKRNEVVVLCTGSQGENRAAMARIATDSHPSVNLSHGDTVIFSSRTIPGNEVEVGRIQNALATLGCNLVTDAEARVHVTGHPRRDELRRMYALTKPKTLIPMHGEGRHLEEHAKFARANGIPASQVVRNGTMVRLLPGPVDVVDEVPAGRMYRDGSLIIDGNDVSVRERRKLAEVGVVFVALAISRKGEFAADPEVVLDGVPAENENGDDLREIVATAVERAIGSIPRNRLRDQAVVREAARRAARSAVQRIWGKRPICKVALSVIERG